MIDFVTNENHLRCDVIAIGMNRRLLSVVRHFRVLKTFNRRKICKNEIKFSREILSWASYRMNASAILSTCSFHVVCFIIFFDIFFFPFHLVFTRFAHISYKKKNQLNYKSLIKSFGKRVTTGNSNKKTFCHRWNSSVHSVVFLFYIFFCLSPYFSILFSRASRRSSHKTDNNLFFTMSCLTFNSRREWIIRHQLDP